MNFDKLFTWVIAIVLGYAVVGKLDTLQHWIWTAQAKVIAGSRTSNWGSPRFFPERGFAQPANSNSASK
jgi:hypothetical protein